MSLKTNAYLWTAGAAIWYGLALMMSSWTVVILGIAILYTLIAGLSWYMAVTAKRFNVTACASHDEKLRHTFKGVEALDEAEAIKRAKSNSNALDFFDTWTAEEVTKS